MEPSSGDRLREVKTADGRVIGRFDLAVIASVIGPRVLEASEIASKAGRFGSEAHRAALRTEFDRIYSDPELSHQLLSAQRDFDREWELRSLSPPGYSDDMHEWEILARVAGLPEERIVSGQFASGEVVPLLFNKLDAKQAAALEAALSARYAAEALAMIAQRAPNVSDETPQALGATPECEPSDDFSSIRWYGAVYHFTRNQAAVIRILWDHWARGGLAVSSQTLRDKAGVVAERLDVVFRGHPAWKTIIVAATKGSYRLVKPEVSIPAKSKSAPRKRARK